MIKGRLLFAAGAFLAVFLLRPLAGFTQDYFFPSDANVTITKDFPPGTPRVGDTLTVRFTLFNQSPDTLEAFYYADHIPPGFKILMGTVAVNGIVLENWTREIDPVGSVYENTTTHRWIIDSPNNPSPQGRILPYSGSVQITYQLICQVEGEFNFPNYNWAAFKRQATDGKPVFGYGTPFVLTGLSTGLMYFKAYAEGRTVTLTWAVSAVESTCDFEIQRSRERDSFQTIGFVRHTEQSAPQTFTFVDREVQRGVYRYRLKQIYPTGSYQYSHTIRVQVGSLSGPFPPLKLLPNFPNPFNPSTTFRYQLAMASHVTLSIHDTMGREVARLIDSFQEPGEYWVSWDASGLASGVYFCQLRAGTFVAFQKIVRIR